MKINKELQYNILIIITLVLIDFVTGYLTTGKKTVGFFYILVLTTTFSISFFSIYLSNYYFFLPRLVDTKRYLLFAFSIVGMTLAFAGIRFTLEEIISPTLFNISNYNLEQDDILFIYLWDSALYGFKAVLYSTIIYLFFRYREHKNKLHELQIQHQQAQLATLKSQISPHFLFNTLNNFYVELYDEKPETANDILKLSQLLRYVTYEASDDFVFLEKEVQFIEDYLYFFKRRYEHNFHVHLSINGTMTNHKIPSLILIHFVENVCKHGIINNADKPAKIGINIKDHTLEVFTENYKNTSEKYMESGIGTENIQKRLEVLYKNNYTLDYQENNDIFKAYLQLPL